MKVVCRQLYFERKVCPFMDHGSWKAWMCSSHKLYVALDFRVTSIEHLSKLGFPRFSKKGQEKPVLQKMNYPPGNESISLPKTLLSRWCSFSPGGICDPWRVPWYRCPKFGTRLSFNFVFFATRMPPPRWVMACLTQKIANQTLDQHEWVWCENDHPKCRVCVFNVLQFV